jgi:hypothetical protein
MKYGYLRLSTEYNKDNEVVIFYKGRSFPYRKYRAALLDVLGDDGWELINVVSITSTDFENQAWLPIYADTIASFVYTANLVYHFKKEMTEDVLEGTSEEYQRMFKELKAL